MGRNYIKSFDGLIVRLAKWALRINSPSLITIRGKGTLSLREAITNKIYIKPYEVR